MIQVTKDFTKIPTNLLNGIGDYNHNDVKTALINIYHDKCCYCEQKVEDFEVEHYRPKKAPRGKNPAHNGYAWLRLEWSNLLWACSTCNAGIGGKHSKFPIMNSANRIIAYSGNPAHKLANSSYLLAEGALLIHPEIENPEAHLTVLPNGKLNPINGSRKGAETIGICNLNRDRLRLDRRKARIDGLCKEIVEAFIKAHNLVIRYAMEEEDRMEILQIQLDSVFGKLERNRKDKSEFALLHRVFYRQFNQFIAVNIHIKAALIPSSIRAIQTCFIAYKKQNP